MSAFNEDTLVQQTTADYLHDVLGWESVYAFDTESFGPDSLLGRASLKIGGPPMLFCVGWQMMG